MNYSVAKYIKTFQRNSHSMGQIDKSRGLKGEKQYTALSISGGNPDITIKNQPSLNSKG